MDALNSDVTFIPNPSYSDDTDERKMFTREDIGHKVHFSLMFSYAELRAFNPLKIWLLDKWRFGFNRTSIVPK